MKILSDTNILQQILSEKFSEHTIFLAEQMIIGYIGNIPKEWDEKLSVATAEIYKKLERDNGIKSESVEWHSIQFTDAKNVAEFIGPAILIILDGYKSDSINKNISRSFSLI